MFVDYYSILDIPENATLDEVKIAFRKQAIKWHPDRNHSIDTTKQMQLINEANLILKDTEARERFNREYQKFKTYRQANEQKEEQDNTRTTTKKQGEPDFEYRDYKIKDETLKQWMANAKRQAVDLAKQTIKEFSGMVSVGIKEGAKAAGRTLLVQIIIGIIFIILLGLYKSCDS